MGDNSDPAVQSNQPIASFTVAGDRVAFAIQPADEMTGGNRIVQHKRPYRKGAKLDSTGAEPRVWCGTAIFNNSVQEPGLDPDLLQFPDVMQQVIDLFDAQETGDLITPFEGKMRARAQSYVRMFQGDEDDTGYLKLTFVEDNEDNVDATSFARPNVKGSLIRLAEETIFTAEAEGVWNGNLADLQEFCSNIEGIINAPGEAVDSVVTQVRAAQHAMRDVLRTAVAASDNDSPVRTIANIKRLLDVAAWAPEEHNQNPPQRVDYLVNSVTTIWAIASDVRQSPELIQELNDARIDDPFAVQPGVYRVPA